MKDGARRWEKDRANLHLIKTLGEGEFGIVKQAVLKQGDQGPLMVAVKFVNEQATQKDKDHFLREIELMKEVTHPNVVQVRLPPNLFPVSSPYKTRGC